MGTRLKIEPKNEDKGASGHNSYDWTKYQAQLFTNKTPVLGTHFYYTKKKT